MDGVVILSNIYDILIDLKNDLHLNEINLLKDVNYRDGQQNVMVTCPVHKGGQESKAACGISATEINRNGKQYPAGQVHCFTCGYTADFFEFVSLCWGTTDRNYGRRYIIRKYNTMELSERPTIKLNCGRTSPGKKSYSYIDEGELNSYRFTSDYLYSRGFEDTTILFYEYGLDQHRNTITMPVRDHRGGLVFIKHRLLNPSPGQDKYLNATGVPKQYILYGFYQALQLINAINNGTCSNKKLEENYKKYGLALVEGEFNASYLMQNGFPAVSLLGRILFEDRTGKTIQQKELLLRYGIRQLILWPDNDFAGQEALSKIYSQTCKQFIVRSPDYNQFPDLNDANNYSSEQLNELRFVSM